MRTENGMKEQGARVIVIADTIGVHRATDYLQRVKAWRKRLVLLFFVVGLMRTCRVEMMIVSMHRLQHRKILIGSENNFL